MDKQEIKTEIKNWCFEYQKAHHRRTHLELRAKKLFLLLQEEILK